MALVSYYTVDSSRFGEAGLCWDVTLIPGTSERQHLLLTYGIVVNNETQHLHSVLAFLNFLLAQEAQVVIRRYSCLVPVWRAIAESHTLHHSALYPAHYQIFLQALAENQGEPPFRSARAIEIARRELD